MRYAFGLVSLLVVTGIILLVFAKYEIPAAQKGLEAKDQVQPIVGQTSDGIKARDSVKVDGQMVNGQLQSLLVTSVTPGGYFDQYYGLKVGDKVLQINGNDVGIFNDPATAEAELWSVQSRPITISRAGKKLTLTVSDGSLGTPTIGTGAVTPGGSTTPAAPSAPAPGPGTSGIPGLPNSIQVPNQ